MWRQGGETKGEELKISHAKKFLKSSRPFTFVEGSSSLSHSHFSEEVDFFKNINLARR